MNATSFPRRCGAPILWFLLSAFLGGFITDVCAAPPAAQRKSESRHALKRLGDFFFGSSRQSTTVKRGDTYRPQAPAQTAVITSSYAAAAPYASASEARISPEEIRAAVPAGRSQLVLPVTPGISPRVPPQRPDGEDSVSRIELQVSSPAPASVPKAIPEPVVLPPVPERPDYGIPVPGSRGYVYAPRDDGEHGYVIDVRGMVPGAKVRDPHTGQVFLVPPF